MGSAVASHTCTLGTDAAFTEAEIAAKNVWAINIGTAGNETGSLFISDQRWRVMDF